MGSVCVCNLCASNDGVAVLLGEECLVESSVRVDTAVVLVAHLLVVDIGLDIFEHQEGLPRLGENALRWHIEGEVGSVVLEFGADHDVRVCQVQVPRCGWLDLKLEDVGGEALCLVGDKLCRVGGHILGKCRLEGVVPHVD